MLSVGGGAARTLTVGQLSALAAAAEPSSTCRREGVALAILFAPETVSELVG
jgi:hypothetical protein